MPATSLLGAFLSSFEIYGKEDICTREDSVQCRVIRDQKTKGLPCLGFEDKAHVEKDVAEARPEW